MTNKKNEKQQTTVAHLRSLMPQRQIEVWESMHVAELQANRLRSLLGDPSPCFDINKVEELPRINVTRIPGMTSSGSTQWLAGAWRIQLNRGEALVRQRFTLAHEIKHVLDAPKLESAYADISATTKGERDIERICDHFAACLLMPRRWVKRLWGEGIHDIAMLASAFEVSPMAMTYRLQSIGLLERPTRCQAPRAASSTQWTFRGRTQSPTFQRQLQHQRLPAGGLT